MTHIAAISLYVDGWKTNIFDLREDVRLENKQYVTATPCSATFTLLT